MVTNKDYWRDRELDHMAKAKISDAQLAKLIASNQKAVMKDIEKQIEAFYGRYASTEGITMNEARKRVSKLDIEDYAAKAKRYVKGAHSSDEFIKAQSFTDLANEEMRIYNVTMKVNRLELLKSNIALELAAMTSDEERFMLEELTKGAREEYARQAGILGHSLNYTEKSVADIVNSSFLNATWSDRLWSNQQALKSELNTLLNKGIVQGKGPRELARELRKKFGASIADSERLMITELARVQGDVFMDSASQLEIEEYEYIAEPGACKVCAPLDGKIIKIDEAEPGYNMYPMHPHCRCSSALVSDRAKWEAEMDERESADSGAITVEDVSEGLLNHEDISKRAEKEKELEKEFNDLYEWDTGKRNELAKDLTRRANAGEITTDEYFKAADKLDATRAKNWERYLALRGEISEMKERHVYENAKTVKEELSKFRAMGIGDVDLKGHLTNPRAKASKAIMEAYDYYPTDWVRRSAAHGTLTSKSVRRGYYSHDLGEIALSGSGSGQFRTTLHELAHRQEYIESGILDAEKAFYAKRTKGEDLVRLKDVTGLGYKASEVTRVDNFISPYMGKVYPDDRAFELLTMGLDTLYTHPQELAKDPEMFKWVVEMILTK